MSATKNILICLVVFCTTVTLGLTAIVVSTAVLSGILGA